MSSGNASSDMARKQVELDLAGGKLVVKGVEVSAFSVDCAQPRLNLRHLYNAVFSDIAEPIEIWVSATAAVLTYRKSKAPEVIVYLEADRDKGVLLLVVKNIGNGVAYDLRLDVGDLPVKDDLKKSVGESFVRSGIPMLVLDAQRSAIIHANSDAEREFGDKTYWALLRYYRSRGGGRRPRLPISDKFVLEYYTFASALYTKSDQYLSRVALEKIAGGIGK